MTALQSRGNKPLIAALLAANMVAEDRAFVETASDELAARGSINLAYRTKLLALQTRYCRPPKRFKAPIDSIDTAGRKSIKVAELPVSAAVRAGVAGYEETTRLARDALANRPPMRRAT